MIAMGKRFIRLSAGGGNPSWGQYGPPGSSDQPAKVVRACRCFSDKPLFAQPGKPQIVLVVAGIFPGMGLVRMDLGPGARLSLKIGRAARDAPRQQGGADGGRRAIGKRTH